MFNFANQYLYNVAKEYAQSVGEYPLYSKDRRQYIRSHPQLREPGWHKKMYANLYAAMDELLVQYPGVNMEEPVLYAKAIRIAEATGLDWADCMLVAEHEVNGFAIQTLDKELLKYANQPKKSTGPVTGMRLS